MLTTLDHEQKRVMDARGGRAQAKGLSPVRATRPSQAENVPAPRGGGALTREPAHYFRMMKELALLGFFTSKIGCTEALRYVEAPGRFDPCIPYTPGEPAWAAHA